MNNKVIAGIVIVIVVIAVAFLAFRHKGGQSEVASNNEAASTQTQTSAQTGSIKSLIAAGKSQKCTFTTSANGYSSSGTVYVGNGKVRGDFANTSSPSMTHMINDGKTNYMWSDDGKFAFKMAFDPTSAAANVNSNAQTQQGADINKDYDWSCESWSVDNSKFDLPSGVNFMEVPTAPSASASSSVNASASSSTDVNAIRKQACNALSGAAKNQCLAAIK